MKKEKNFSAVISDVKVGEPAIIRLTTGEIAKTTPVENYFHSCRDEWKIVTRNTIYRSY